ncbi:MAG: acetyl-CoA carboxylase biotin carboxyl carrier protein [bacterium]
MREDEIKRLVKIVEESDIAELTISRWGRSIKITKTVRDSNSFVNPAAVPMHSLPSTQPHEGANSATAERSVEEPTKTQSSSAVEIKAPMVGTFYRAPAPDADPYVETTQRIKKGQVLCIIEAMKLMNEIESEYDGKLLEVLVENGQPVEYNQPLFRIEVS